MKLCPYCYNPLSDADVDQLQAENAKLREERDHWHVEQAHAYGNWEDAYRRATELEAENFKLRDQLEEQKCFAADLERDVRALRELVRHMRSCFNNEYTEYGTDFIESRCEDCEYDNDRGWCDFESRMRELGVGG